MRPLAILLLAACGSSARSTPTLEAPERRFCVPAVVRDRANDENVETEACFQTLRHCERARTMALELGWAGVRQVGVCGGGGE